MTLFSYMKIQLFEVRPGCCSSPRAIPIIVARGLCFICFIHYDIAEKCADDFLDFGPIKMQDIVIKCQVL